jgi:hypothetical protein
VGHSGSFYSRRWPAGISLSQIACTTLYYLFFLIFLLASSFVSQAARAKGVIDFNQTADPGAFLVGARSRFFGHYSIFLSFSTLGMAQGGTFLVYKQMFNQSVPHQIVQ